MTVTFQLQIDPESTRQSSTQHIPDFNEAELRIMHEKMGNFQQTLERHGFTRAAMHVDNKSWEPE